MTINYQTYSTSVIQNTQIIYKRILKKFHFKQFKKQLKLLNLRKVHNEIVSSHQVETKSVPEKKIQTTNTTKKITKEPKSDKQSVSLKSVEQIKLTQIEKETDNKPHIETQISKDESSEDITLKGSRFY